MINRCILQMMLDFEGAEADFIEAAGMGSYWVIGGLESLGNLNLVDYFPRGSQAF